MSSPVCGPEGSRTLSAFLLVLLFCAGAGAQTPQRICGGLPNGKLFLGGEPTTVALTSAGNATYIVNDGSDTSPYLQYFPVSPASGLCAPQVGPISARLLTSAFASQRVAGGDFNGDGIPDAASLDAGPNQLTILLGDGSGALHPAASYTVGSTPQSLIAADFNGDGRLDLAFADSGGGNDSGGVYVLLGAGDGTFHAPVKYAAGSAPVALAAGDFNGDGLPDLAIANSQSETISILLGVAGGSFRRFQEFSAGGGPVSVLTADFNSDGFLDLAIANGTSASLTVFLGNGSGSFPNAANIPVSSGPSFLASADFNGDGKPDLAVLFPSSNMLSILTGTGNGQFGKTVSYVVGTQADSLAFADLDGDGILDILAPDPDSLGLLILWGSPDGSFDGAPFYPVGGGPNAVIAADINGDGLPDLVVPNQGSSDVSILLGAADGSFRAMPRLMLPSNGMGLNLSAIASGDFNGDGIADLAITEGAPLNQVMILLGAGNGQFEFPSTFPAGLDPAAVAMGDFDGDGNQDLAIANMDRTSQEDFGNLTVLYGNGDGSFHLPVNFPAGIRPYAVVAGDFNGDGRPDLAVAANGDVRSNQLASIAIFLGQPYGKFAPAQFIALGDRAPTTPATGCMAVGDLNGDGNPDLVVAGPDALFVLLGAGDGTFQVASFPADPEARSIAIADLDGDGNADLVIAHCCGLYDDMSYMLGNGDGTFQSPVNFPGGAAPIAVAAADFNGDGKPDLAVANSLAASGSAAVLLNRLTPAAPAQ